MTCAAMHAHCCCWCLPLVLAAVLPQSFSLPLLLVRGPYCPFPVRPLTSSPTLAPPPCCRTSEAHKAKHYPLSWWAFLMLTQLSMPLPHVGVLPSACTRYTQSSPNTCHQDHPCWRILSPFLPCLSVSMWPCLCLWPSRWPCLHVHTPAFAPP